MDPDQRRSCEFPARRSRSRTSRKNGGPSSPARTGLSARRHRLPRPSRDHRSGSTGSTSSYCGPTTARRRASPSPKPATRAGFGGNPEFAPDAYRLSYSRWSRRSTVYDYHPGREPARNAQGPGDPLGLRRLAYAHRAADGAGARRQAGPGVGRLPKGFEKDGKGKLFLYAYGAYGIAIPPGFSTSRISLLDRGWAYAIAHIRGGDDLGYNWFLDGKLTKRNNSFNDFVDVAKGLIAEGFTKRRPDRDQRRLGRRRADGRGRQSATRICGARSSPTCPSSTCSTPCSTTRCR